jgi:ribosomal protein L12E/L44/L45/RPP1/RPP2
MATHNPLSQVPPEEFVQARNALVRQLREKGDAGEARRVAALRRPTASLWVVNQLGRRAGPAVDQLVDATRRARKAQMQGGGGDELRETMQAQREALQKLLGVARDTAGEIGVTLSPEQERRIQDTLQTAAATEPDQLRAGALDQELSATGFDALLSGGHAAAPAPAQKKSKSEGPTRAEERKRQQEEKRERAARLRDVKRAQGTARQLVRRADQLDKQAQEATTAAERAKTKAEGARRAANDAAARLLELQSKT